MCYRTKIDVRHPEIEQTFNAGFLDPESFVPMEEINAFDFLKTPVITHDNPGEIQMFNWGLIPFWARDNGIRKMTLNAKIETVSEKPAFRDAVKNRCLIIANGYYEWQWKDPKGKSKQKYLIQPKGQEIFAFAGIYGHWKDPQNNIQVSSYSILTTEANELMSEIHNNKKRMPVILKKEDRESWLSGKEVSNYAFPYEVDLEAKPLQV